MKKLIITASGLLVAAGLFVFAGVPGVTADTSANKGTTGAPSAEIWEHMNQMRNIMHDALVTSQALPEGVLIEITSPEAGLAANIQEEFAPERHELSTPIANAVVTAKVVENGVALSFTSTDAATVQLLQGQGNNLFYGMLHDNMRALMVGQAGNGARGRGHGPNKNGKGYGSGNMGQGRGYGSEMMGEGRGHGSGIMTRGYGPDTMGHGWGRGSRMMSGGYGPAVGNTPGNNQ